MKQTWVQLLLRGGLPFAIMLGIAKLLEHQGKQDNAHGTFVAAFIALFIGASSLIYDIDTWSLGTKIGVHFLVMLVTVYPTLLLSGWFRVDGFTDALKVFGYFVAGGAAILAVYFLGVFIKTKLVH